MTPDDRVTKQTERAREALAALDKAKRPTDKLDAAKALESAACQLRRALKAQVDA